jgi:hypothetical protein
LSTQYFPLIRADEISEACVWTLPGPPEIERHLAIPGISFDRELEVAVKDSAADQGLDQLGALVGVVGDEGRTADAAVAPAPGERAESDGQAVVAAGDSVTGGSDHVIGTAKRHECALDAGSSRLARLEEDEPMLVRDDQPVSPARS